MKKALSCLICLAVLIVCLCAQAAVTRDETLAVLPDQDNPDAPLPLDDVTPQEKLEVWFGRVGPCDAIVIRCNGEVMMIDGGNIDYVRATNRFIDSLGMTRADYLFNTHHHDDHLDAMESLVRRDLLKAKVFLTPYPRDYNVARHLKMQATVDKKGIQYQQLKDGDTMLLGGEEGALFEFFRWDGSTDANYSSMFCRVSYGLRSIILMADVTGLAQVELAKTRQDIPWDADVMKAGHHGYSRQDPQMLSLINPELCVITNSRMGGDACVRQMMELQIPWLVTNGGTIYLMTDGGDDWVYNVDRVVYD